MMNCARFEPLLPAFHDDELDSLVRREFVSHVASCVTCSRHLAGFGRIQELLAQTVEEEVAQIDFSGFWTGVVNKMEHQTPSWTARFQMWRMRWRLSWPPPVPLWAAAALLIAALLLPRVTDLPFFSSPSSLPVTEGKPLALAANSQAHIESLSTAATVALWNEPASNATVIWVGDAGDGGIR
jgi:anti-sigma factor RsiW